MDLVRILSLLLRNFISSVQFNKTAMMDSV